MTGATLEFAHIYALETGYDYGYVEVSSDGGTSWEAVATYDGFHTSPWETVTLAVPQLDGVATARIRFRHTSDWSTTADGWHVDDIQLRAGGGGSTNRLFSDGFEAGDTSAWSATVP